MDFKSKRIYGISQIVICLALLLLYTRVGSIGTVYVAIIAEIILGLYLLLFHSVPNVISNQIRLCEGAKTNRNLSSILKAGGLYCLFATILAEAVLLAMNRFVILPSGILFVGTLLKLLMFFVPLYAFLQYIRGIMQAVFQPQINALSDLIFWVSTTVGTFIIYLFVNGYGKKAALLMQSIKLEHFYVILCLVPGLFVGAIGALIFLSVIGLMHKEELMNLFHQPSSKKDAFILLSIQMFPSQISGNLIPLLQKIPVWIMLFLSIKEIKAEHYLFGHLYGAILPLFGVLWNFFDIPLMTYKKRLYTLSRKRMQEQYYKDLKIVLSYVLIHSIFFLVCIFSLPKSYLAIWSMQTSGEFMGLMKASALIAFLGFPYMVLMDLLKEKNAQWECTVSVFFGVVMSAITSAICNKFLGVGNPLYILSIVLGLFVSVFIAAWFMSSDTGINYLSVLRKTYKLLIVNVFICVILLILQNLIFTAFGGLGTLVICVLLSYLILWISIRVFGVFSKEERNLLSFKTALKSILQISR